VSINISVIIPTYNRGELLLRAVRSVLGQTHEVLEILVCDDGSTDDSFQLLESLNDFRVRWIDCGRNGRPAIPRNIGVREARGEWIAFLDSDDEWSERKIEYQVREIRNQSLSAICSNALRIVNGVDKGLYLTVNPSFIKAKMLVHKNIIICSSVLLEKRLLDLVGGFSESESLKAYEDYELWLRISMLTSFKFVSLPLVRYNDDPVTSIRGATISDRVMKQNVYDSVSIWLKTNDSPHGSSNFRLIKGARLRTIKFRVDDIFFRIRYKLSSYFSDVNFKGWILLNKKNNDVPLTN
jgi:teichuronic acid biosynthesis glycosyltransferase TuaG